MKIFKAFAIAVIAMFAVESAKAQVVVSAHIGTPPPPVRTVVVERPVAPRVVVVNRYRTRPHYRRAVVVAHPVYYRPRHRRVIVRHY